jgi:hypothetical protein
MRNVDFVETGFTGRRISFLKDAVFWDVAPCRSCLNRRFGGTYRFHLQGRKIRERGTSMSGWLQTEPTVENIVFDTRAIEEILTFKSFKGFKKQVACETAND